MVGLPVGKTVIHSLITHSLTHSLTQMLVHHIVKALQWRTLRNAVDYCLLRSQNVWNVSRPLSLPMVTFQTCWTRSVG